MSALKTLLTELQGEIDKITPEEVQGFKISAIRDEKPIAQMDDEDLKKLWVLIHKKKLALRARLVEIKAQIDQTDSRKEEEALNLEAEKEMEAKPLIEAFEEVFWFLIRKKYNAHQGTIGIRQGWVIVKSFNPGKCLFELFKELGEVLN